MGEKQIVHIGCFMHIPGGRMGPAIKKGSHYTCFEQIDMFKDGIDMMYDELSESAKEQVKLVYHDARHTFFPDNSVDEVHMYNVLGDPSIKKKDDFFSESNRILKPKKSLFIGETITPYGFEDTIKMARKNGFGMKVIVPHPLDHVSETEVQRFYELFAENTTSEAYNRNFDEWYGLLERLCLSSDLNYRFSETEIDTVKRYRGNDRVFRGYLLELIKN